MVKNPASGTASQQETDEYFAARNRELTRRALERNRDPSTEPPMKSNPVEYAELFNTVRIQKNYGGYSISYESGRGFRKKPASSGNWSPASPDEIRVFKNDAKAAAGQDPNIARYIANDPEFK